MVACRKTRNKKRQIDKPARERASTEQRGAGRTAGGKMADIRGKKWQTETDRRAETVDQVQWPEQRRADKAKQQELLKGTAIMSR